MEFSIFLFMVAQLADVVTTTRAIRNGGIEGNPLVARVMGHAGGFWALPKFAVTTGAGLWAWNAGAYDTLLVMSLVIFCVALWNIWVSR